MHLGSSKSIQSSKQSHQKQKNLEKCQLILQQRNISNSFQSFFLLQSRFFRQTNHYSKQIPIRVRWLRPLAGAATFFMVINDEKRFPNRNKIDITPPLESNPEKKINKILDSRMIRKNCKDIRELLCRFKNRPADEDEWRAPPDIPDSDKLLRNFRISKRQGS